MWVSEAVKKAFEDKMQKTILKIKQSGIPYYKVGVFGSYSREEYKATSDIDFCVIMSEDISREQKGSLKDDAEELGVDIIFVTQEYYLHDESLFARNLRRDFKEITI